MTNVKSQGSGGKARLLLNGALSIANGLAAVAGFEDGKRGP